MKQSTLGLALRWALLICTFPAAAWSLAITRTSAPVLYVDSSASPSPLSAAYVSYQINNNDSDAYQDLWVTIGNFVGGNTGLAENEPGFFHLGLLDVGASKTAYFYIQGTATASAQSHDIKIYGSRAFGTVLASATFSLS